MIRSPRERERERGRGPRNRFLGYSALHQGCMRVASRAEETLTTTPSSNASVAMKTQVGAREWEWRKKLEREMHKFRMKIDMEKFFSIIFTYL